MFHAEFNIEFNADALKGFECFDHLLICILICTMSLMLNFKYKKKPYKGLLLQRNLVSS